MPYLVWSVRTAQARAALVHAGGLRWQQCAACGAAIEPSRVAAQSLLLFWACPSVSAFFRYKSPLVAALFLKMSRPALALRGDHGSYHCFCVR